MKLKSMMQEGVAIRLKAALIFLLLLLPVLPASAELTFNISGKVRAKASGFPITDAKYRVYSLPDSTIVKEGDASQTWMTGSSDNYQLFHKPDFKISGLSMDKKYLLEVYCDNYDPVFMEIDPSRLKKKEDTMNIGYVDMVKALRQLDEVTVTATKVKFYYKGDTLIYNADAFRLAEGSMLDALIRQLPGAELKDGGQIFVNNRKIESLLLNSKDFFKGNSQIMLENLGAYAVKNIAVYDRQDEMDRIMGEGYGERKYTMDVRLKKEYMNTYMLNAEGGYGTEDKYLGRLFTLWNNEVARIGAFGNANNISITGNPSQYSGSQTPPQFADDRTTYSGGVDYSVEPTRSKFSFEGSADIKYTKAVNETRTYTTNFLPLADTYDYSFADRRNSSLEVYTEHAMKVKADSWNMQIQPKFRYTRNKDRDKILSGTFTREWDQIDRSFLENIFNNNSTEVLSSMINRYANDRELYGHNAWYNIWSNGKFKVNSTDALTYLVAFTYNRDHSRQDQDYMLKYVDQNLPSQDFRRRYDNYPDFNWRAKGAVGYIWRLSRQFYADISYTYQRYQNHAISDLYSSELNSEDAPGKVAAMLPSSVMRLKEYPGMGFDADNSYDKNYKEETHDMVFDLRYSLDWFSIGAKIPASVRRQWLDYQRGTVYPQIHRNKFFLGNVSMNVNISPKNAGWIYIAYDRTVSSPDLVNMVDFTDRLNPLFITKGNPGLKDADSENARVYYTLPFNKKRNMTYKFGFNTTIYRNSLAFGYSYDRQTGVKTGRMYNVMGNAHYDTSQGFEFGFGKNNCMSFENRLEFDYDRSADLITLDANTEPTKNIVNRYGLSDRLGLGWSRKGVRIKASANAGWNRYLSDQTGFEAFNAWNIRYGVTGNFKLPKNFGISTDFDIYSRRGYSEPSLNTDNFVWNARLSYSILKGQLLFMLDGFDILHSLSNVNYTVNAQARTETYKNVLPRYFMFHVQWNFTKLPKKK